MDELYVMIFVIVLCALVALYVRHQEKKRISELNDYAVKLGLSLDPGIYDDYARFERLQAFDDVFGMTGMSSSVRPKDSLTDTSSKARKWIAWLGLDSSMAKNTLSGSYTVSGQTLDIFAGYHYVSRQNDTVGCPYAMVRLAGVDMPRLIIREEEIHHKFMDDVDFTGHACAEKFSKRFFVRCEREEFARGWIQPVLMEVLLATKRMNWLEFVDDTVCLYHEPLGSRESRRNSTGITTLVEQVELMEQVVAALPKRKQ